MNLGLRDLAQEVKNQQPCPELNSLTLYLTNMSLLFSTIFAC